MRVLSRLPCDGTFRQEGPLHRLSQKRPLEVDSFDLSSATDRWPVPVIHDVIACLFGPTLASCIVNGSLALSSFCVGPPLVGKFRTICTFSTGQPLGYYGSWALFSLSHHYMVWLAAWLVDRGRTPPLTDYALLGDDIVIAHKAVAQQY
ncbi:putative mitochondrial protein AtMg01110, partial [Curcuma longa]|uniref:putative mitochondrial protein AtMg01110 n=1 Tax=Curcuma longa TaxID=136217 RepID=UPI003D9F187B